MALPLDPGRIFAGTPAPPVMDAGPQIQTMGAPALPQVPGPADVAARVAAAGGRPEQFQGGRPQFGNYIPQGLVQMLMRLQQNNPQMFSGFFDRPMASRFGLTPETDLANLYTRQMARQDFRGGTQPMMPGTILSPDQRAAYPAMRPWPDYAGGGMGNNAPAQPGGGQGFQKPMGMAERQAPGTVQY